jgi:hypothetical protein
MIWKCDCGNNNHVGHDVCSYCGNSEPNDRLMAERDALKEEVERLREALAREEERKTDAQAEAVCHLDEVESLQERICRGPCCEVDKKNHQLTIDICDCMDMNEVSNLRFVLDIVCQALDERNHDDDREDALYSLGLHSQLYEPMRRIRERLRNISNRHSDSTKLEG